MSSESWSWVAVGFNDAGPGRPRGGGGRWTWPITDSDIIASDSPFPICSHTVGKADGPLERRVSGCPGGSRSKGEGQHRALRCLFVPQLRPRTTFVTDIYSTIDARLADRTAKLATPSEPITKPTSELEPSSLNESQRTVSSPLVTASKKQPSSELPGGASLTDFLNTTRADLSEAQRSRSELQDRLNRVNTEFEKLRKKSFQDGRRLNALENERLHLQQRLKDSHEELRQKAKLLEVGNHGFVLAV